MFNSETQSVTWVCAANRNTGSPEWRGEGAACLSVKVVVAKFKGGGGRGTKVENVQ